MQSIDVISLKDFYASTMGRLISQNVLKSLSRLWPNDEAHDDVLTIGYAFPYLSFLSQKRASLVPVMMGKHGAMYWPANGKNTVVLAHEWELPFQKHSFNRIVLSHVLEHTRHPVRTMTECWNILMPGGRMLIIVPNRRSLWAQAADTPLGWGQPYSAKQLKLLARNAGFTINSCETLLFSLPLSNRLVVKMAPAFELLGKMFLPMFGGIVVMEVEKQIYANVMQESFSNPLENIMVHSPQSIAKTQ
jgi:SAM-dependent methyltransferase